MRLTKQQFIDRLPEGVFTAILSAAKASVDVEAWLFRFNAAATDPDGTSIDLADPRTITGVNGLVSAGLMSAEQGAAFLDSYPAVGGFVAGQSVRILPPFDAALPGVYVIEGFGPDCIRVAGAEFAAQYVEAAQ